MSDLRIAKQFGRWMLRKDTLFYLNRRGSNDDLFKPTVVLKMGTVVEIQKLYRRGRAALMKYTDRSKKEWRSWTHASEFEPPRKYAQKTQT